MRTGAPGMGIARALAAIIFSLAVAARPAPAQTEPNVDEAETAAEIDSRDTEGKAYEPQRPANLPDLTKGETIPLPKKGGPITWNMGPTGIIGIKNGGFAGDQVRVVAVLPGSPAEGRVLPGDVVLGVQGKDFVAGGHLGLTVGNAIVRAEEEAGKGLLSMHLWRDRNWIKRGAPKDLVGVDLEELFKKAEEDADLYEWKEEEEKTAAVKQMAFDEFPIDGIHTNITLQLEVMGTYSDTSPWDCPVTAKIRGDACKVIAAKFTPDKNGRFRGANWPGVLALVASGNPEYLELARQWVHSQKLRQDMNMNVECKSLHYGSWYMGFDALEMAIYYDATGDDYVLPEIRYRAIWTAMAQSGGGSWGHSFPSPMSNGGQLHMQNTGYGGMNNAGTRCFFLLTLARKFGIKDPEIDAAIARSERFFSTYVDKGCIPYGDHAPWPSDDSNGKNFGAAYAFYTLGKTYEAKYFAMNSNHASFSRRGGHGSPTLWYYTPLSANICGPRGVQQSMRNMRWFYTLSRRHDGSFVFQGEQAGIGGKGMRDPTATLAMFYAAPLQKLITTGKQADTNCWFTDKELKALMVSARGQVTDPQMLAEIGKPWPERGTDELIDMLDHFYPNVRRGVASELGKRFNAGEKDIVARVLPLLQNDAARFRDGACLTLAACGADTVLGSLSRITPLLNDPAEVVRMTAVSAIGKATEPGDENRELLMLQAAADEYEGMTMDFGNVRSAVKGVLFPRRKRGSTEPESKLSTDPFQAGYDYDLVWSALASIVTMDPGGTTPGGWTRDTLLKMAGPVVFVAEETQINDAMFRGGRKSAGQALLRKYGYREAVEADASNLVKRHELDRAMRVKVGFKDPYITPAKVKQAPSLYRFALPALYEWLQDSPVAQLSESNGKGNPPTITPLTDLVEMIEKDSEREREPSIVPDVEKMFRDELAAAGGTAEKTRLCREELQDPTRKNYFRKMAAMTVLAEMLGAGALDDVGPYLGHENRRVRERAEKIAGELAKGEGAARLIELFKPASVVAAKAAGLEENERKRVGNNAAAMLLVLAKANVGSALDAARQAMKNENPTVRRAAVQAVMTLGGEGALPEVFAFMRGTSDPDDLQGCEQALLSRCDDPGHVKRVSAEARAMLPDSALPVRRSLAWVLGQFGGEENLAAIQQAAAATEDDADLKEMVMALAYSPDRAADKTMLELVKQDNRHRDAVAALSVHRMVGRNGVADVTDEERVAFARGILNVKYNNDLLTYLGNVHTGPSVQLLYDVMKQGRDSTGVAAKGIIRCVEGMENPPPDEAKIAADVLAQVIEYIEVTQLRGGVSEHMGSKEAIWAYAGWKTLQARAGKAMLKIYKPEKASIPTFDAMDLDL